ncbi:TonB-dependent receptor plug domain-containing protein [Pseudobacteriovorax antillogorgiicola]|uniref:Iron complex outermembrane recepter protein n=1 Tax=Pseudobacteriovorax antillogorgiicola TaxID=1513793 RepID=A0A1Y6C9D4_9BACT|nr:TonB-dependent receptor [Pseudobacteriovorax antillogorgiicola]TCS49047.1 iron complex outermembrane receptor protein [Pseudobacteriovorax antillogorgiicola]SMF52576.1 iron complex outermembrane recepter protein [Pseudobacteriovorax antillogorgiicola]
MKYRLATIPLLCATCFLDAKIAVGQDSEAVETMVVTGTRKAGKTAEQLASPVDIIEGDDLANQGDTELTDLMRNLVPSFNVTTQPISDAGTIVRPANLRGLPPDSTLVLINGKRRHRAAVISFLGQGVSDGAQGVDLSMIPAIAVERAEVLRDGASALYGSDAIAGVMNFVLKDNDEGARFEAKAGSYYEGDGTMFQYAGNVGTSPFEGGFANFSFEYREADATSRSIQRDDAASLRESGNAYVADPAQTWGQPEVKSDVKLFANFGQTINNNLELYAFGNYGTRDSQGGFYYRNPTDRLGVYTTEDSEGNVSQLVGDTNPGSGPDCSNLSLDAAADNTTIQGRECFSFTEVFPGGFTPRFGGRLVDSSGVFGLRGEFNNGFRYDLSGGVGRNEVEFYLDNTVNASLGPNSPTTFEPGGYIQEDEQFNLDVSYPMGAINLAAGLERRRETFTINAGDEASYANGPLSQYGFSIGSNGFSGFSPDIAGKFSRYNNAAYLDVESDITRIWSVGLAGRYEEFEDFGVTRNGRLSTRLDLSDQLVLRGTISTGFRAPTPGQANVTNTTTAFEGGSLIDRGTIPPTNPIAQLYGGEQLKPETSQNYTFGAILKTGSLRTTVDYFNIAIKDRIAQSVSREISPEEAAALEAAGYAGAGNYAAIRFYTNAFETETQGVDLIMSYPLKALPGASVLRFAGNWTETKVIDYTTGILDEKRIRQLEEGLPQYRANLSLSNRVGSWRSLARVNYFGPYYEAHLDSGGLPIEAGEEFTVDAELGVALMDNLSIIMGAQNIFNEFPDEHDHQGVAGAKYPETAPMGFNGGFYYGKLIYFL